MLVGQEVGREVGKSIERSLSVLLSSQDINTQDPVSSAGAPAVRFQETGKKNNRRAKRNRSQPKVRSFPNKVALDLLLTGTVELTAFLTNEHAETVFSDLINLPFEKMHHSRSAIWYGPVDYAYSSVKLIANGCLESNNILNNLSLRLYKKLGVSFNSCLVNLYENEGESCGWHADDEQIFGEDPTPSES